MSLELTNDYELFDGQATVYEPGKGCYRCLYQYRLGRSMEKVSRDNAKAVLAEHGRKKGDKSGGKKKAAKGG